MKKPILLFTFLLLLSSACVTIPHSAHSIAATSLEKPIAPEEGTKIMVPVSGGVSFYDVDPPFAEDRDLLNDVNLRSYFGEAGVSFAKRLQAGSPAGISGGISAFSYSGRSIGPEEALLYGQQRRNRFQGYGGRLNFGFDLNYDADRSRITWRVFNAQVCYARESGAYGEYRQVAIDSSRGYNLFYNSEYQVTPSASDFLSAHFYTEVIFDYMDYGLVFGIGGLSHYSQDDIGSWSNYLFSGSLHAGFNIKNFYARVNFGTISLSFLPVGGPFDMNLVAGYRFKF